MKHAERQSPPAACHILSLVTVTTSNPDNPVWVTSAANVRIDFGINSIELVLGIFCIFAVNYVVSYYIFNCLDLASYICMHNLPYPV